MVEIKYVGDELWDRIERALENVKDRLKRVTSALNAAEVPYAIIGGNAVQHWVAQVDESVVRNTRGQRITYDVSSVGGANMVTSTSRASSPSCPVATASSQTFDPNFLYLTSSTDFAGSVTNYQYTQGSQLASTTVAAGTNAAHTTTNTWTDFLLTGVSSAGASVYNMRTINYVASGFAMNWKASEVEIDVATGNRRTTNYAYAFFPNGALQSTSVARILPSGAATTTTVYSATGQVQSISNALGHTATFANFGPAGRHQVRVAAMTSVRRSTFRR